MESYGHEDHLVFQNSEDGASYISVNLRPGCLSVRLWGKTEGASNCVREIKVKGFAVYDALKRMLDENDILREAQDDNES